MNQQIVVKTYRGTEAEAIAAFQRDAPLMSQQGYYPISQTWTPGEWHPGCFLAALALCLLCIGIIVFFYMLIVKPPGTLAVTYQFRSAQPPPLPTSVLPPIA
jgi:hypothetical protein